MKNNFCLTMAAGILLSASAVAGAQVVVRIGPPPPRPVEVVPVRPVGHPDWVWHAGFHRWDGQRYVWVPGSYVAPPYRGARWVPGHWANRRGGWVFIDGHWRR